MDRFLKFYRKLFGYRYTAKVTVRVVHDDGFSFSSRYNTTHFTGKTPCPMNDELKESIIKGLRESALHQAGNPPNATVVVVIT